MIARKLPRALRIVAFLGPDGVGKSTILNLTQAELTNKGVQFSYHYFAPGFLRRYGQKSGVSITRNPHEGRQYGCFLVLAKILLLLFEFRMGIASMRSQPRLALFDRYLLDILVDPKRYRMERVRWWMRALLKFAPKPDLLVIISAPSNVIQSRKQEVSAEETARQVSAYEALAEIMAPSLVVQNTSTPEETASAILARLESLL